MSHVYKALSTNKLSQLSASDLIDQQAGLSQGFYLPPHHAEEKEDAHAQGSNESLHPFSLKPDCKGNHECIEQHTLQGAEQQAFPYRIRPLPDVYDTGIHEMDEPRNKFAEGHGHRLDRAEEQQNEFEVEYGCGHRYRHKVGKDKDQGELMKIIHTEREGEDLCSQCAGHEFPDDIGQAIRDKELAVDGGVKNGEAQHGEVGQLKSHIGNPEGIDAQEEKGTGSEVVVHRNSATAEFAQTDEGEHERGP